MFKFIWLTAFFITFYGCSMAQGKLEKDASCYAIVFAEPFVKKEYGAEYKKKFQLLDVCPKREKDLQYPGAYIPIERDGKIIETQFDVLKTFANETEAREFTKQNKLTNTPFLPKNDCEIIRIIDFPLTKRPNVAKSPAIALLNTCLFDEIDVQRPSIDVLRLGKKQTRLFEIIKVFENKREAEKYAKANELFDIDYNSDSESGKIDAELTQAFHNTMRGEVSLELSNKFKNLLKEKLKNSVTFNQPLINLEHEISVKTSPDKQLKFYSWDTMTGGTWHLMTVIAQYKDDRGSINLKELRDSQMDKSTESTDYVITHIYEIEVKKQKIYLTFGWGTRGGGTQFNVVKGFRLKDSQLLEDSSVLPNGHDLTITFPRSQKSELNFNQEKNEISYREFVEDKDSGFMQATGKIVTLKLINGRFIK